MIANHAYVDFSKFQLQIKKMACSHIRTSVVFVSRECSVSLHSCMYSLISVPLDMNKYVYKCIPYYKVK